MRNLLIILFIFLTASIGATTYYIAPSGSGGSNSNNGSIGSPWLTLTYACANTNSGDVIHVKAGTFAEVAISTLKAGVNIEGEGSGVSIITSNISTAYQYTITLSSAEGTNGNQHISGIGMDGLSLTGWGAIVVYGRSNVIIHDCNIHDFFEYGVVYNAKPSNDGNPPAAVWATGNSFYNNTVTNCDVTVSGLATACLNMGGQDGLTVYNCTFDASARAVDGTDGSNGFGVKLYCGGYNKNIKFHDNTIITAPLHDDDQSWSFAYEDWSSLGGIEIYNNTIYGVIDLAGVSSGKGISTYSYWVHNNTIGNPVAQSVAKHGIYLEGTTQINDVIIEKNILQNHSQAITLQLTSNAMYDTIRISCNIFKNVGANSTTSNNRFAIGCMNGSSKTGYTLRNWQIYNNTFIGQMNTGGSIKDAIYFKNAGTQTYMYIQNNIFQGFTNKNIEFATNTGTIDNLWITNNDSYNNGNSNDPAFSGNAVTNYTTANNIKTDPTFVSSTDFHLQSISGAINTGLVGLVSTDYSGYSFANPPSIGAYQYFSAGAPTIKTYRYQNKTVRYQGKTVIIKN